MSSTITIPDYEQAKAIYGRLCAKARQLFNRESDEGHALCTLVQSLSHAYDFFRDGLDVSALRCLTAQDRADVLALVAYLTSEEDGNYFPAAFGEINRDAFSTL